MKSRVAVGLLACAALAGCSANTATAPSPGTVNLTTAGSLISMSAVTSVYDVRVPWPTRFGSGFPARQWYPSFAYYYPYLGASYRSYGAWGRGFVHPRYGWQPMPGIGYINDEGARYPADISIRRQDKRPTVIDGIDNYSVGRSTWSVGSR